MNKSDVINALEVAKELVRMAELHPENVGIQKAAEKAAEQYWSMEDIAISRKYI